MAQSMKDVKAITIPQGSVKKIEDSNGNIIWGSQAAFPYRKLEYIHFNGTDNAIPVPYQTKEGYYLEFVFTLERNNVRQMTVGMYDQMSATNTNRRYYLFDIYASGTTQGCRACIGNTFSTTFATADIPLNTKLKAYATTQKNNSNQDVMFYNLSNAVTETTIFSGNITNSTTETLSGIQPYLMGGRNRSTDGTSAINAPTQGKIYQLTLKQPNSSGTIVANLIPVQRKSDGKVGLYNIQSGNYINMAGTQDLTSAGPVVDEYWDLQS